MRIAFAQADGDRRNGQQIRYRSKTDPKLHIDLIVSILSKSAQDDINFLQDTTSDIGVVLKMRSRQPKSLYIKLRESFLHHLRSLFISLTLAQGCFPSSCELNLLKTLFLGVESPFRLMGGTCWESALDTWCP